MLGATRMLRLCVWKGLHMAEKAAWYQRRSQLCAVVRHSLHSAEQEITAYLRSRLTASAVRNSVNLSFAKPGPAMTRHFTMSQSMCRTVASRTCKHTPK